MKFKNEEKALVEAKKEIACRKSSAKLRAAQLKRDCVILSNMTAEQQTKWNECQELREESAAVELTSVQLNKQLREFEQNVQAQTKQWVAEDARISEANPPAPKKKKSTRKKKSSNISKKRFLHTLIHMATILQNDNRLSIQFKDLVKEWKLTKTFNLEAASKLSPAKKSKEHSTSKRNVSADPGLEDIDVEQLLQNEIDSVPPLLSPLSSPSLEQPDGVPLAPPPSPAPQVSHAGTQTDWRSPIGTRHVLPKRKVDTECSTLLTFNCQDHLIIEPEPEMECEADPPDKDPSPAHSSVADSNPVENRSDQGSSCNGTSKDGIDEEEEVSNCSETSILSSRTAKPPVQQWLNSIPLDPEDPHFHRSISMSPTHDDNMNNTEVPRFGTTVNHPMHQPYGYQPYLMPNLGYPPMYPPYMIPPFMPCMPYTPSVPQYNNPMYGYGYHPAMQPMGGFPNAAWPQMCQTQPTVLSVKDKSVKRNREKGLTSKDNLAVRNKKEKDFPSPKKKSKLLGPASVRARRELKAKQDKSISAIQEPSIISLHSSCSKHSILSVELKSSVTKRGKVLGPATERSVQEIDTTSESETETLEISDSTNHEELNKGHTTKRNDKLDTMQVMRGPSQNTDTGEKLNCDSNQQNLRTHSHKLHEGSTKYGTSDVPTSENNIEDDECTVPSEGDRSDSSSASSCIPLSVLKRNILAISSESEDSFSPISANQKTAVVASKTSTTSSPSTIPSQIHKSAASLDVTYLPSQPEVDSKMTDNKKKIKTPEEDTATRYNSDKGVTTKALKRLQGKRFQKSKQVSAVAMPTKKTQKTDKEGGKPLTARQVGHKVPSTSTEQIHGENQEAFSVMNSTILEQHVHRESESINHSLVEPSTHQETAECSPCSTIEEACSAVLTEGHLTPIASNEISENYGSKDKENGIISATVECSQQTEPELNAEMEETSVPLTLESPASPEDPFQRGEYVGQSSTVEIPSVKVTSNDNTGRTETSVNLILESPASPEDPFHRGEHVQQIGLNCRSGTVEIPSEVHSSGNDTKVLGMYPLIIRIEDNSAVTEECSQGPKKFTPLIQKKLNVSQQVPVQVDIKCPSPMPNSNFPMEIATTSENSTQASESGVAISNNSFNDVTKNIEPTQDLEISANVSPTNTCQGEQTEQNELKTATTLIVTEVAEKALQVKPVTGSADEAASCSDSHNTSDSDVVIEYAPKSPVFSFSKKRKCPPARIVESKPLDEKTILKSDKVISEPKIEIPDIECEGKRPPKVRLSDRPDLLGLTSPITTPKLKTPQSTIQALKNISLTSENSKMKNGVNLKKAPAKKISKLEKVRSQVSQSHGAFRGLQPMQAKNIKVENSSESTNNNRTTPQLLEASRSPFQETLDSQPMLTLKKVSKPMTRVKPPSPEPTPQVSAACRDSFRLPPGKTGLKQDETNVVVLSSDSSDPEFITSHVKLQCTSPPKAMKKLNNKKLMAEIFGTLSDEDTPNSMHPNKELMEELFGNISDDDAPKLMSAKSCKLESSRRKKRTRKQKSTEEVEEWWKPPITEAPAPSSEQHKSFEKSCLSQLLKFQPRKKMQPSVPRARLLSYDCRKISIILERMLSANDPNMEAILLELQGFFPGTKVATLAEAVLVVAIKGVPEKHILELIKHLDEARWVTNFNQTLRRIIPSCLMVCTPGVMPVMKTAGEMLVAVRLLMKLCESPDLEIHVRTLLVDLLCHFRIRGIELAYMMLKLKPNLLPVLNQSNVEDLPILTQCIINAMLSFDSEGKPVVAELEKLLSEKYHIVDTRSPLQLLDYVANRLQAGVTEGAEMGLFLLAKRQGFEWSKSNMVEDVLQMLVDKHAECPAAAQVALRLIGKIVRLVPYMEQDYLLKVMKRVKQFLLTEGLSHELQESAVHSLLFMAGPEQVHQLFACLAPWQPQQPISVKLLSHMRAWAIQRLPPLIPAEHPRLDPPPQPKPLAKLQSPTLNITLVNLDSP